MTLVTQLQLSSDEISRKVGQITDNVVKSMPRMLYDLKLITDDAQTTKRGIEQVRQSLLQQQDKNNIENVLERLRQLHLVKTRMEKCCTALREAENWNNLEAEASRMILDDNHDYENAAKRLQSAQQSLEVFRYAPEYEQRKALLTDLQNKLEDALRPQVRTALATHDAAECCRYYKVYGRIGRADDFVDLYFEARSQDVLKQWHQQATDTDKNWLESLDYFYKSMFVLLSEEYVWCASIFPDPKPVVQALVQHLLQSLDPSLADRLASIATHQGASALPKLIAAFQVTESFGLSLERLFSKPPVVTASTDYPVTYTNRRRSNSNLMVPLTLRRADPDAWSYVLYVPFLPFQSQYGSLEGQYLRDQLKQLFVMPGEMVTKDTVARIFGLIHDALDRCLKMTHGFGAVEWIRTVNSFMGDVKAQLQSIIRAPTVDKMKKKQQTASLDDLDFETEDAFQLDVRLLGVCEALDVQLRSLHDTVCRELENVRHLIQEEIASPATPSFSEHQHQRRRSMGGHERRRSSTTGINKELVEHPSWNYPRSSLALLKTSRFNSHELQRVMNQVSSVTEEGQESVIASLMRDARERVWELTRECQELVHQTILAPIVKPLENLSSSLRSVWSAPDPRPRKSTVDDATVDIDMPEFSLSPNEYITRVGEQLLMLPQQFEVYADDTALLYHVETIPFWENSEEEDMVQLWTGCVARGAVKRFLDEIVKIRNMSSQGRRQLRTDITYLINVLSALDVQPSQQLVSFYESLDANN